mmetsp:Transcript_13227/g.15325  ORF Transcript_13227/g.15325 Transcript_13227/m.15325 type:complete len:219 (-) Transcript_13227:52-708(-)
MNSKAAPSKPVAKNPLLAKEDVGKGKPCTFKLPSDGFAYGKADRKDSEGAKEVTSSWAYHQQSKTTASKKDFMNMNKVGIAKGAVNAKEQAKIRKEKDMRVSQEPKHKPKKAEVPCDVAYGVMNRPSTPIKDVISNSYGIYAEMELQEKLAKDTQKPAGKTKEIKPTKAYTLMQQKVKNVETKNEKLDNFKMKKFQKVESRVKAQIDKDKKKREDVNE